MPRFTTSLTDEQDEWLRQESDRRNRSKADIVRMCIDMVRTGEVNDEPDTTEPVQTDVVKRGEHAELENRVADLEQRVSDLEANPRDTTPTLETPTDDSHTDLLEYVREHGPVKAGELKDNCYPEDHHLARSTWWTKRAKERLKESNAQYTNNIGWRFE